MNFSGRFRLISRAGVSSLFSAFLLSALSVGFTACGSDSNSASDEAPPEYSSAAKSSASVKSSDSGTQTSSESKPTSSASSSKPKSSASSETTSSEEILNEAKNVIKGTCAPTNPIISKGEIGEWKFYREGEGDIFDQILAPFVWAFEGAATTNVQGNGMDKVTIRYPDAGSFAAYLNVDGNDIACESIQVQGIPIVINSCKPNRSTAKAGETITWTVDAESESPITAYTWTSAYGELSGSGTSGSIIANSAMHKQSVSATVAVTNADNSVVKYACDGVSVVDPESEDLILPLGSINDADYGEKVLPTLPDSLFIPAQTATTVQIPAGAKSGCIVGCKPRLGSDYMNTQIFWDSDDPLTSFAYFTPNGCAPGKKYTVTASVTVICVAN